MAYHYSDAELWEQWGRYRGMLQAGDTLGARNLFAFLSTVSDRPIPFDAAGNAVQPQAPAAAAPAAPPPPPAAANRGELSRENQDAYDRIRATLQLYSLAQPDLLDWARGALIDGKSESAITLDLYDPSTVPGKVVDRMYPELKGRRDGNLRPISIAEAVQYRDSAFQMMRAAGFPTGFYDEPEDLANFQIKDVSLAELKTRIDGYTVAATSAPAETRAQLQSIYGIGAGGLAAYYADPGRALPVLEKQFAAATISGAGVRSGYGGLNRGEAERLASLGVGEQQAAQGFGALVENRELFLNLPGRRGQAISREQQLGAVFGGDQGAQAAIERKRRAELNVFGSRGGLSASQSGVGGLGSAAS